MSRGRDFTANATVPVCKNQVGVITFFYTIFCVRLLDFTTRYGIIIRHGNPRGYNILYILARASRIWV